MAKVIGLFVWTYGGAAVAVFATYQAAGLWPAVAVGGALATLMGLLGALLDEIGEARP